MPESRARWIAATIAWVAIAGPALAGQPAPADAPAPSNSPFREYLRISAKSADALSESSSPESQFQDRLSRLASDDVEGLFALALWADEKGMDRRADQLYRQVLQLDENHAGARRALKYVFLDQHWQDSASALQILGAQLDGGLAGPTVEAALNSLAAMELPAEQDFRTRELLALLQLRRGKFPRALEAYAALAEAAPPAQAPRISAICEILRDHGDGLYVLTETYPSGADLLGARRKLSPGPVSLAHPLALPAALRDKAREFVRVGARLMEDGRADEPIDPESARQAYLKALEPFDQADALAPEIARNYKVELTRRQIGLLRKRSSAQAAQFDSELALLGRRDISPQAYAEKVTRMTLLLSNIRNDLEAILRLAMPYDRDLVSEIRWAEADRDRIDAMLNTLRQEMHEGR